MAGSEAEAKKRFQEQFGEWAKIKNLKQAQTSAPASKKK
jgi:hypothetical protein